MKNIIEGTLIVLAIFIFLSMVANWIGRSFVYSDKVNTEKMEYCIGQQKPFEDCWLSVYRGYDYQKKE